MSLPLLISLPHAGLRVPAAVRDHCVLTEQQIVADGDEQAADIYSALDDEVAALVTTDVARAIVDMNRSPDDRHADGVIKTHTCWNEQVYEPFPPEDVVQGLLDDHYHPYHRRLQELADPAIRLAVDCHTMAANGPPVGPDPGAARPVVCLSDGGGTTCPRIWVLALFASLREVFGSNVRLNDPFQGGYITRFHSGTVPWVQLELSRGGFAGVAEKREGVRSALRSFCAKQFDL